MGFKKLSKEAIEVNENFRKNVKNSGMMLLPVPERRKAWDDFVDSMPPIPTDVEIQPVDALGINSSEWVISPEADTNKVLVYFHGGGYVIAGPKWGRHFNCKVSQAAGVKVLSIDYRRAPEHPFPAQVEDALKAYEWILAQNYNPENVAFIGESSGGGLVFSALIAARDKGIPLPSAGVAISPWIDLTSSGESYEFNKDADPMLASGSFNIFIDEFLQGQDPKNPLASPLYAEMDGLPPILINVGSTECLLDDSRQIFQKLSRAGVDVTIEVEPEMPHCWHFLCFQLPEARNSIRKIGVFLKEHMG